MNNDEKIICKEFQTEIFLYMNKELSTERITFWEKHLLICSACISEMETVIKISNSIKEKSLFDVDNSTFNKMIETAIVRKSWLQDIFGTSHNYDEKKRFYGKAVLVGALSTIAIIITIIFHQPIPVKNIPKDLLDWEGKKVTAQINELKNTFNLINEDGWDKQIIQLDKRMQDLEKKSDKFSFN